MEDRSPSNRQSPTKRIYKVVLTGGPCGGKTTGQSRLCTFFENLGWKACVLGAPAANGRSEAQQLVTVYTRRYTIPLLLSCSYIPQVRGPAARNCLHLPLHDTSSSVLL
ncbi:hypothetical protein FHG87_010199 [Trinorchestia longiramus]|nr:hypothetical protein FHG87_010199 [Trinorchestia longiramus]